MFSLPCNFPHRSKFCRKEDFSTIKVTSKKVMGHNVDISTREITSKTYTETTGVLRPSKLHRKKYVEKKLEYFDQQNQYVENTWIISTSEITSKKAGGNNMDFSTSEITQKKVHENNMNFSIIEKCTWKLRGFFNQQNYIKKYT